jgi:hypothetical protein
MNMVVWVFCEHFHCEHPISIQNREMLSLYVLSPGPYESQLKAS